MQRTVRVGVFDSGIGGLNVLAACQRLLPQVQYYYYGDNRNAPYGSRPPAEIAELVRSALCRFEKNGVHAAVLACNTATVVCLDEMRREFAFPIIGVEPAVCAAARVVKSALVLCTPRTAESARLGRLLEENPSCKFTVSPCPALAAAIENKLLRGDPVVLSDHLPQGSFDGVVLGCTHYAFLREGISSYYQHALVFDGSEGAAQQLALVLEGRKKVPKWSGRVKTNVYFHSEWRERPSNDVIFLGPTGSDNAKIYKQTFKNYKNDEK